MKIREALKALLRYPLEDIAIEYIIQKRGLEGESEYCAELEKLPSFIGAKADTYFAMISAINFSESGISVSSPNISIALREANYLYRSIGEEEKYLDQPTVCVGPPPGTYVSY